MKGEAFDLPDGTATVTLAIWTLLKNSGTFDFDDVILELTREQALVDVAKPFADRIAASHPLR